MVSLNDPTGSFMSRVRHGSPYLILGTRGVPNQHGGFEALAEYLLEGCTNMGIECLVIGNRDPEVASTLMGRITALPVLRSLETPLRT